MLNRWTDKNVHTQVISYQISFQFHTPSDCAISAHEKKIIATLMYITTQPLPWQHMCHSPLLHVYLLVMVTIGIDVVVKLGVLAVLAVAQVAVECFVHLCQCLHQLLVLLRLHFVLLHQIICEFLLNLKLTSLLSCLLSQLQLQTTTTTKWWQ